MSDGALTVGADSGHRPRCTRAAVRGGLDLRPFC
jgi:hypothetical protein